MKWPFGKGQVGWKMVPLLFISLVLAACREDAQDVANKPAASTVQNPTADPIIDPVERQEHLQPKSLVLALSWQAGFCETHMKKPECRSQHAERYDATHFTLHGLWPQPRRQVYCDVNTAVVSNDKRGKWRALPPVQTSDMLRDRLQKIMPGTRSALDRHEWIKHGTCYSKYAQTYYRDSLALMDAINTSAVQKLFATHIGKYLASSAIRRAFDKSFGNGTGKRVRIACKSANERRLITEITLGLRGVVTAHPDIGKLARNSGTTKPGCPGGIVDPVGLQK